MPKSIRLLCIAICVSNLLVSGCAPLKDVREYAASSVKLSSYKELPVRFRDTYEREKPFLSPGTQIQHYRGDAQKYPTPSPLPGSHKDT